MPPKKRHLAPVDAWPAPAGPTGETLPATSATSTTSSEPLDPPAGLGDRGASYWSEVTAKYTLDLDELQILTDLCRTLDMVDKIAEALRDAGLTVEGSQGQLRPHPLLAELRLYELTASRLHVILSLPDQGGSTVRSPRSSRASKAARARWDQQAARRGAIGGRNGPPA